MTHGSHYLGKLYNDLIINSPQTISMDIPSDMGRGRIAQTKIKHGVILSDWQMCYQSDMNVQGPVSKDYMQIIFCLNDGISWGIMDDRRCGQHTRSVMRSIIRKNRARVAEHI